MYSVNVGCSYVEAVLYPTTTTNKIGHLYFVSPFLFTLVCSPKPPSLSPPLSLSSPLILIPLSSHSLPRCTMRRKLTLTAAQAVSIPLLSPSKLGMQGGCPCSGREMLVSTSSSAGLPLAVTLFGLIFPFIDPPNRAIPCLAFLNFSPL
jgi:hypothetical protein